MDTKRVLVIGGTGFIGSYIIQELLDHGCKVTILCRHPIRMNHDEYTSDDLQFIYGDFLDTDFIIRALTEVDVCIHLIHTTIPSSSMDSSADILESVLPTARLLAKLPHRSLKSFIYISSGGTVYGRAKTIPIREDHPTDPISGYGVAKLTIEKYVRMYGQMKDIITIIVRPSNVYGPGQNICRPQGAVGIFMNNIHHGHEIDIWGNGENLRDYIFVRDLAIVIRLAVDHRKSVIWNVGTGSGCSLIGLIKILEETINRKARIIYHPARNFDVSSNVLDITRIRKMLGWRPSIDLEQGIKETYCSYLSKGMHPYLRWCDNR